MKKELNPLFGIAALVLVAIVVIVVGYNMLGPKKFVEDKTGSDKDMKRVESGQPMYTPPAGVPGLGGAPGGGAPPGAPGPGMAPGAPTGR
ncbi:MAG: hypothetical protein ACKO5K_08905 [Armatimonadota bacterium]